MPGAWRTHSRPRTIDKAHAICPRAGKFGLKKLWNNQRQAR
jgi:hypothetical protein